MRWLAGLLLFLLIVLQYRLWLGEGGMFGIWRLSDTISEQKTENAHLQQRNDALEAEVHDLKDGLEAVEERARQELGMIKSGETFYQVVEE